MLSLGLSEFCESPFEGVVTPLKISQSGSFLTVRWAAHWNFGRSVLEVS